MYQKTVCDMESTSQRKKKNWSFREMGKREKCQVESFLSEKTQSAAICKFLGRSWTFSQRLVEVLLTLKFYMH